MPKHVVLVVEEDPVTRRSIASLLGEEPDLIALEAHDGDEALRTLAAQPADLVLFDLALPEMDDLAFVRRLRAALAGRTACLLAMSTLGPTGLPERIRAAGIEVVEKPFGIETLLGAVRRALTGRGTGSRV